MSSSQCIIKKTILSFSRKLFFIAVLLLCSSFLCGATYYWRDAVTEGNWSTNTNWSTTSATSTDNEGTYPKEKDSVYITGNAAVLINFTEDISVQYLYLNYNNSNLIKLNTNGKSITVGNFMLNRAEGTGNSASNVEITGGGSLTIPPTYPDIDSTRFDFPASYDSIVTIDSGTTLAIHRTYYGDGGAGNMYFYGDGILSIPASGAYLNYGANRIKYGSSLHIIPYESPSYYYLSNIGHTLPMSVTFNVDRTIGGTIAVSFPYIIEISNGSTATYTFNGSTVSDGDSGSIQVTGNNASTTLSITNTEVSGKGISVIIYTPDGALELGRLTYYQDGIVWTGASTLTALWDDPANWIGGIPTSGADVTINAGVTKYPVISSDVTIKSLTITSNAEVTMSGGTLTLSTLECSGNSKFTATGGTVVFTGIASWEADFPSLSQFSSVQILNGAKLTAKSDMTLTGSFINNLGGKFSSLADSATIYFTPSSDFEIAGNDDASDTSFYALSCTKASGKKLTFNNNIYVNNLCLTGDSTTSRLTVMGGTGSSIQLSSSQLSGQYLLIDGSAPIITDGTTDGGFTYTTYNSESSITPPVTGWVIGDAASVIWTGSISNNWNDLGNWSTGAVPVSGDTVVIPGSGILIYPKLSSAVNIGNGSILIDSGASLDLNGHDLTADSLTINGTLRLKGSESFNNVNTVVTGNTGTILYYGTTATTASLASKTSNTFPNLTIYSSSTLTLSTDITVKGDFTNYGTFNADGKTVSFSPYSKSEIFGVTTFAGLTCSGQGGKTLTINSAINVTTLNLTGSSTSSKLTVNGSGSINLASDQGTGDYLKVDTIPINTSTYTVTNSISVTTPAPTGWAGFGASSDFIWTGTNGTSWTDDANWGRTDGTYPGFVSGSSDTVEIPSGLTNYPILTNTCSITEFTMDPGANITLDAGSSLTVTDSWKNEGTVNVTDIVTLSLPVGSEDDGSWFFNGTNGTIYSGLDYRNITVNSTCTVSGNIKTSSLINNGTYNTGAFSTTTASYSGSGPLILAGGTFSQTASGTITIANVELTASTSSVLNSGLGTFIISGFTGNNSNLSIKGNIELLSVTGGLGNFSNSGTLVLGGNTLSAATFSGTGEITTTSGTITATGDGGTIPTLTVTTGATINGGTGTNGIIITNAVKDALTTTGKVTLNGTNTSVTSIVNSGTLTLNGATTISNNVSNSGTIALGGNTLSAATFSGTGGEISTTSGTITATGDGGTIPTLTVTTGATINGGTGTNGIIITNAVKDALTTTGKVTLNGTNTSVTSIVNSGTLTLNGATTISNNVSNSGTIALGGNTLSAATFSGTGLISATSGTIIATGAGGTIPSLEVTTGVTINGGTTGITVTNATYNSSPFITAIGTVNLPAGTIDALTVGDESTTSNLTIGGGITVSSVEIENNATLVAGANANDAYTIEVGGNWTNNNATGGFTAQNSTVTFTADSTITGSNTFYNFACTTGGTTLTFTAGTTQTIASSGSFTITGIDTSLITLTSSSTSTWDIDLTNVDPANVSVTYADISYSTVMDSSTTATATSSITTKGNNTRWIMNYKWSKTAASTSWIDDANWDGVSPGIDNPYAKVQIQSQTSGTNYPVLAAALTVQDLTIDSGAEIDFTSNNVTASDEIINNGRIKLTGVSGQTLPATITNNPGSTVEYKPVTVGTASTAVVLCGTTYYTLLVDEYVILQTGNNTLTVNTELQNNGSVEINDATGTITKTDINSGTFIYSATNDSVVDYGATDYYNLTIASDVSVNLAGDINIAGSLSASGTINGTNALSVSGTTTVSENTSITTTGLQTYRGDVTNSGIINSGSGGITFGGSITGGTLNGENNATITIDNINEESFAPTTFTHNNCNFVLQGAGTVFLPRPFTYHNFSCVTSGKTVKFVTGTLDNDTTHHKVLNNFTITGVSNQEIKLLANDTTNTYWYIQTIVGNTNVAYASIENSYSINSIVSNVIDSKEETLGSTVNWFSLTYTWKGTTDTNWTTLGNWRVGSGDTVPKMYPTGNCNEDIYVIDNGTNSILDLSSSYSNAEVKAQSLTINPGATIDLADKNLNVATSIENNGTVILDGDSTQTISFGATDSITNGVGSFVTYDNEEATYPIWGSKYCNLTVSLSTATGIFHVDKDLISTNGEIIFDSPIVLDSPNNLQIISTIDGDIDGTSSGLINFLSDSSCDGVVTKYPDVLFKAKEILIEAKIGSSHSLNNISVICEKLTVSETINASSMNLTNSGLFLTNEDADITLTSGSFTQTSSSTGLNQLAGGIITSGSSSITFATDVYLFGTTGGTDSSMTLGGGSGAIIIGSGTPSGTKNLHIAASDVAKEININSPLTANNMILYGGNLTLSGANSELTTNGDLILLGSNYSANDSESGVTGLFSYANPLRPGNTKDYSYTEGFKTVCPDNTTPIPLDSGATIFCGSLTVGSGKNMYVNTNFYANGITITASDPWNLNIPDNENSLDAFTEAYNTTVENCNVSCSTPSGFAWVSAAENCTDNGSNIGWDFNRPTISEAYTVYDDVIRIILSEPIENSNEEINKALVNIKFNNGSQAFSGAYEDSECTVPIPIDEDISSFYLRTSGSAEQRWNTDATGTSSGADESTDRSGIHQTNIPNIDIPKALSDLYETLRDEHKNRIQHYSGTTRYTATADRTAPVLVAVSTGQELHQGVGTAQMMFDSHNFIEFRYSEPVTIGAPAANLNQDVGVNVAAVSQNIRSSTTFDLAGTNFGGAISGTEGLTITGFVETAAGALNASSISGGQPHALYRYFALDGALVNRKYQTHRVRLAVAGYVEGAVTVNGVTQHNWDGYINNAVTPSGNVTRIANTTIQDMRGNTYVVSSATNHSLPALIINNGTAGVYGMWDTSKPVVVPYLKGNDWNGFQETDTTEYEILGSGNASDVTAFEIHFFDNTPTFNPGDSTIWQTRIGWTGYTTAVPLDTFGGSRAFSGSQTTGGIRAATLFNCIDKFSYNNVTAGTENQSFTNTGFKQVPTVAAFFGPLATDSIYQHDSLYAYIPVESGNAGKIADTYAISYDGLDTTGGVVTDLAGNRMDSFSSFLTPDKTPPKFYMTAAALGLNQLYIIFNKPIDYLSDAQRTTLEKLQRIVQSLRIYTNNPGPDTDTGLITDDCNIRVVMNTTKATGFVITLKENLNYEQLKNYYIEVLGHVGTTDPITGASGTFSYIYDLRDNPVETASNHAISDFAVNALDVLYGFDNREIIQGQGVYAEGQWAVRDFSGSGNNTGRMLTERDLTFTLNKTIPDTEEITVFADISPLYASISDIYNINTGKNLRIWLPTVIESISKVANPDYETLASESSESNPDLVTFSIPNDPATPGYFGWKADSEISFLFRVDSDYTFDHDFNNETPQIPFYALRLAVPGDITSLDLWSVKLADLQRQQGGVTILNNVINVNNKEQTIIEVDMPKTGNLTIHIMTIDGDIVKTLQKGRTTEGLHYYRWNGTNSSGKTVARGMYFVRIVGPGIDENRKVMAVKE